MRSKAAFKSFAFCKCMPISALSVSTIVSATALITGVTIPAHIYITRLRVGAHLILCFIDYLGKLCLHHFFQYINLSLANTCHLDFLTINFDNIDLDILQAKLNVQGYINIYFDPKSEELYIDREFLQKDLTELMNH